MNRGTIKDTDESLHLPASPGKMGRQLNACPLCDSADHHELYMTRDRHYGIPGLFRIVQCSNCLLVFLNPMYTDRELADLYPGDYYAYQNHFENKPVKKLVKRLLGVRMGTKDPKFTSTGKVLDLGCGSGWFLRDLREQGWDTYGVEISSSAAQVGQTKEGLNIFCGTLREAGFPSDAFDYIRSNHSFEHIACPNETLQEIHRILKPSGKLMIGVPNIGGLNARVFRKYWWYLGAPVHPFSYSARTLSRMLEKHHFEVEAIKLNSDYSGILGSLQIWLNRNTTRRSSEGAAFNNPLLKLLCHWVAKIMDALSLGDAMEITATKKGDPA